MSNASDYYSVLGVARDADDDVIKKAYRKLAMQFHPDRNPGDKAAEEKFKDAARAYEVLSNKEKRARYDRFGAAGVDGMGRGGGQQGFHDVSDVFSAFGDIFGDFFGQDPRQSRSRTRPRQGADLRYNMEVKLEDVLTGTQREIEFDVEDACQTCEGSGAAKGHKPETCNTCGGRGQVVRQQGFFSIAQPCSTCQGEGTIIKEKCKECKGRGVKARHRKLKISIPAGIESGNQLRLSGEGERGRLGGPSGDLFVEVHVADHAKFERQGVVLHTDIQISYLQAILGAEIEIPTLNGKTKVKVQPGSQPGAEVRVAGEGLPSIRSTRRGELIAHIKVEIPTKLNKDEEEQLRAIAESKGDAVLGPKGLFKR